MIGKLEFYNLISSSFTKEEMLEISEIAEELEQQLLKDSCVLTQNSEDIEINSFYYELCSLFYRSARNFDNFKANLLNRQLCIDYPKNILQTEYFEESRKVNLYEYYYKKISSFIRSNTIFKSVDNYESLAYSLTNALVPELLDQEYTESYLQYLNDINKIQEVEKMVKAGESITRITVDINSQPIAIISNPSVSHNFWQDFVKFSSRRYKIPRNIEVEVDKLQSRKRHAINRVALRICMVLVHYGILSKTTESHKYILINKDNMYISLEQNVMYNIYLFLNTLGQKFKTRENEYGSDYNAKTHAEKVKNLLRSGKKCVHDNFSYDDITDSYWGCLIKDSAYD